MSAVVVVRVDLTGPDDGDDRADRTAINRAGPFTRGGHVEVIVGSRTLVTHAAASWLKWLDEYCLVQVTADTAQAAAIWERAMKTGEPF